jgi:hypothetical protein
VPGISYADGAANLYRFVEDDGGVHFTYDPVTPERSSTGTYSGGDPREERFPVDDPRYLELRRHLAALEADPSIQVERRDKGTGAITIDGRSFVIARGPALHDLEARLGRFG